MSSLPEPMPQCAPYSFNLCPLDDASENLRMLKLTLSPSDVDSSQVEGQIIQATDNQQYAALSWCWGPKDAVKTSIRITHEDTPYSFETSVSLATALAELRRRKVIWLWIDQICINQNNVQERNQQVRLMAKVYNRATQVYVWLGDEVQTGETSTAKAIEFIQAQVLNPERLDNLVKDRDSGAGWSSMVELMKCIWFSRRWVVQEIALARDAVILCGKQKIAWTDFADAVSLFNESENEKQTVSRSVMMAQKKHNFNPRYFGHVPALGATQLVEITNNLFRRRADNEKVALRTLEELVSSFTAFNASEPRDTIYALLAIARDTIPQISTSNMLNLVSSYPDRIVQGFVQQLSSKIMARSYYVNYYQPVSDVFVDFVDFTISQANPVQALDIICRPWAPIIGSETPTFDNQPWRTVLELGISNREDSLGRDTLPSWIPNVGGAAFGLQPRHKIMVRQNGDSLVGMPSDRNYAAAANSQVKRRSLRFEQGITKHSKYEHLNGLHYHSLFVEGFVVDTIGTLTEASQEGNIPRDWATLGLKFARPSDQWSSFPDEYWRTLVADRGKNGNPPRHFPRLLHYALSQHVPNTTFNTQAEIDHGRSQAVRDVLEKLQSVIWNRRLMSTKGGRLGLVSTSAKKDDLIVILHGCSVPVVLRRFTKTREEVLEERKSKLTRAHKLAARTLIRPFKNLLANKGKSKNMSSLRTTGLSRRTTHGTSKTDSSPSRPSSSSDTITGMEQHTLAGAESKTPDFDRLLNIPGAWLESHTTPVSANVTEIVAPGPVRPLSTAYTKRPGTDTTNTASTIAHVANEDKETSLEADEYTFYQLIGECYVHGIMNGEAIPLQIAAEDTEKQLRRSRKDDITIDRSKVADTFDTQTSAAVQPTDFAFHEDRGMIMQHRPPRLFGRTLFEIR